MLNLRPAGAAVRVTIERVSVRVLPEPVSVSIFVVGEDAVETALEPLRTGALLPGPAGPSTWQEALLAQLVDACGGDPAGMDVRRLPDLLTGAEVRIFSIKATGGEHVLVGAHAPRNKNGPRYAD